MNPKLRTFVPAGKHYSLSQELFRELGFERLYSDDSLTLFQIGEDYFWLQNFENEECQNNFMMEVCVDDLDAWWDRIQALDLANRYPIRVGPPKDQPWGKREINLIDPAGVCWHISQPMA